MSQEFQFLGTAFDNSLDYVVGLYYFDEEGKETNPWQFTPYNASNDINALFDGTFGGWYKVTSESKAIFGQATYHFSEAWRLTLGARYTEDEKTLTLLEEDPMLDRDHKAKDDWSESTFAGTLLYFFNDDINVYGKISQGYAAGIYNPSTISRGVGLADPSAALVPAEPEETTAYEIGLKSQFAGGRVQLNVAIFYNDNTNLQSTDFVDGVRRTINSGESDTTGFEVDLIALPADNWTINATYGYSDTDFEEDGKFSTPLKTGNVGAQWETESDYGYWTARLDATYMGETRFSISDPRVANEPRTLWNARLSVADLAGLGGQFRLALWGKNLADEEYIQHGANFGSYTGYTWGQPRSYGVDVAYEF